MDAYARKLFSIAAAFNFAVAGGLLFLRPWLAPMLRLDPVSGTNLVFVNVVGLLIASFGYAYARTAADPVRFRPYIELGLIGKLLVVAAAALPWMTGAVAWHLPLLASADLAFALLFLDFLQRTRVT